MSKKYTWKTGALHIKPVTHTHTLTLTDSGATGGGCLIDGKNCGGYYAVYDCTCGARIETEVLYHDGDIARETISVDSDDVHCAEASRLLAAEIEEEKSI